MREKIIRDPVHDVIAFRMEGNAPGDRLLFDLLATPQFQRLRRVRQLGLASLAYPGADHSRYLHSLGVMEMCRRILEQLRRERPISEEDWIAVTAAALLHDLGHGPFSHVFERVSGIHHEAITRQIIEDEDGAVCQVLMRFDPALPRRVTRLLEGADKGARFLKDVLSSQLDADRLDYLLRDDLMTGSRYGQYDLQWLLRSMTIDGATGRLAINYKGISAVEGYLQARMHMYRNVYFHKVVRTGEGMLSLALQRARRLAVQGRLPGEDPVLTKALLAQRLTAAEFLDLDDVTVLHCFKVWAKHSDDAVLVRLCHGMLYRELYKTVELPLSMAVGEAADVLKRATEAVAAAGGDPRYDLFYDEPINTPYEAISTDDPAGVNEIQILDRDGQLKPFTTMSPFGASLAQFAFRRIHVRDEFRDVVARVVARD